MVHSFSKVISRSENLSVSCTSLPPGGQLDHLPDVLVIMDRFAKIVVTNLILATVKYIYTEVATFRVKMRD